MKRRIYLAVLGVLVLGGAIVSSEAQTSISSEGAIESQSGGFIFPDGTVQTTAAAIGSRRSFYLTTSEWNGALAPLACATGYHMASLWEIFDVSTLRYATELSVAEKRADSGQGPPTGLGGWIRTGSGGLDQATGGLASCLAYTSNLADHWGTRVYLSSTWETSPTDRWIAPWRSDAKRCNDDYSVWCVEDE